MVMSPSTENASNMGDEQLHKHYFSSNLALLYGTRQLTEGERIKTLALAQNTPLISSEEFSCKQYQMKTKPFAIKKEKGVGETGEEKLSDKTTQERTNPL